MKWIEMHVKIRKHYPFLGKMPFIYYSSREMLLGNEKKKITVRQMIQCILFLKPSTFLAIGPWTGTFHRCSICDFNWKIIPHIYSAAHIHQFAF